MFYKIKLLKKYIVYRWWFRKVRRWSYNTCKYFGRWYEPDIPNTQFVWGFGPRKRRSKFEVLYVIGPGSGGASKPSILCTFSKDRAEVMRDTLVLGHRLFDDGTRFMKYLVQQALPAADKELMHKWGDLGTDFSEVYGYVPYTDIEAARHIGETVWRDDAEYTVRSVQGNNVVLDEIGEDYETLEGAVLTLVRLHTPDGGTPESVPFGKKIL